MAIDLRRLPEVVGTLVSLGARRVVLFGSAAENPEAANDIDLAVEGIAPRNLLRADVRVGEVLQQPYDLVSRETHPEFFELVLRYGKVLYG